MPSVPSIDLGNKHSQPPYRLYFILGMIEWNGLLEVCVDISYQVKAIEVVLKRLLLLIHSPLSAACAHELALYACLWLLVDNIPAY